MYKEFYFNNPYVDWASAVLLLFMGLFVLISFSAWKRSTQKNSEQAFSHLIFEDLEHEHQKPN